MIRCLKHSQIDKVLWDNCVDKSPNGLIYSYSWYLDVVNPGWEALVTDNYEIMMPLPVRKKFGLTYLINPYFSQQLGIISAKPLSKEIIENFIIETKKIFRFADFNFNFSNSIEHPLLSEHFVTYLLPLNRNYEIIYKAYDDYCTQNLTKAKKATDLYIVLANDSKEFIQFYKHFAKFNAGKRFENTLENITNTLLQHHRGEVCLVKNGKDETISAVLWAIDNRRAYYLVACNNSEGRESRVNFLIIDTFIQKHCNTDLTIDFEGSMIPGVAKFNKSFGAEVSYYPRFRYNNLPFPLNMIKK